MTDATDRVEYTFPFPISMKDKLSVAQLSFLAKDDTEAIYMLRKVKKQIDSMLEGLDE